MALPTPLEMGRGGTREANSIETAPYPSDDHENYPRQEPSNRYRDKRDDCRINPMALDSPRVLRVEVPQTNATHVWKRNSRLWVRCWMLW